ncbi:type II and III secretion system protein family protein [Sphingobium vermicomposti]|uniref:Pilus assembly protein CpaC n=1 Tax=Sphingobium vermicomposti TaxID=529005 RepID=A0A846M735_9SPHN|nr:pilus assembly protein N-terminal domain-containing protein [Sphingobium vermicomposti]NIJ18107.1 pilus assembly protein CpaC [Sphingobium vermicomposti]
MPLRGKRTITFTQPIGRVEVDHDNIISVAAPSARSLRLTGVGAGTATLRIFGVNGALLDERIVTVGSPASSVNAAEEGRLTSADRIVAGEQVVAVDVQFAAISTSTLKALGFNFAKLSGGLQGAIVSPSTLTSASFSRDGSSIDASVPIQNAFNLFLSSPNRGVNAVLSALSSNGLSELLAQPTLLVRSGEQASFLAGGEIPVPVPQASAGSGSTISIQYKEFGVRLAVTPFVLSKDNIVLKIAPEVSELDYANGVQLQGYVIPGLRRRSAETTVELGSGQSFVIAGLSYSSQSVTRDKTPLLGDIPVLGAFFRRQQSQKERQELVIVATPRLVGPVQAASMPALPGTATDAIAPDAPTFGLVRR